MRQNPPGDYIVVVPERNYWGDGERKCLRASFPVGWAPRVSPSLSAMHSLAQVCVMAPKAPGISSMKVQSGSHPGPI